MTPQKPKEVELRMYKDLDVLRASTIKDSVYFVLSSSTQKITEIWVTTNQNIPKAVDLGSSSIGLITSPDGSIDITTLPSEIQLQIESTLLAKINSALQPGDNVSELVNDGDGISPFVTQVELDDAIASVDIVTDPIPVDGSVNPIQSNGVFDALLLKEDKANKQNSLAVDGTGTKYPTVDAVNIGLAAISIPDATTTVKGKIKLAGDLAGTADLPTVPTKVDKTTTLNVNGVSQDLSTSREWRTAQADTGVLTFVGLTTNSATTINIGAVTGYVVNNETNPLIPTSIFVNYVGATNVTVTTVGSGTESFVMLNSAGIISFQNIFPTSAERKAKIWLGKVSHPSGAVTVVVNEPDYITSPMAFSRDMFQRFAYVNDSVYPYANGANLNINITGGSIGGNGINFVNDKTRPNDIIVAPGVVQTFTYRTQVGGATPAVTAVSPGFYDVGGVITPVGGGSNSSTLQYIYIIPGQGYLIQYGQTVYNTLASAISSVGREPLVIYPNLIKNSLLIGVLAVNKNATRLNDTSQAQFFKADIFGQIIGATSGTSTGTLQTAYNNSLVPQIQPTDALGALTLKSARALNTSTIQEWQNIAGVTKASISGNGDLFINSIGMRNVADTFTSFFTNLNTASRTYTLPDKSDTIATLSDLPSNYSNIVYVNNIDPNSATIFALENPPLVNDNTLKINVNNLYIGTDASTWVYNISTLNYITKVISSSTSNFFLSGTTTDAGNTKTADVVRVGGMTIGSNASIAAKLAVVGASTTTGNALEVRDSANGKLFEVNNAKGVVIQAASNTTGDKIMTWGDSSGIPGREVYWERQNTTGGGFRLRTATGTVFQVDGNSVLFSGASGVAFAVSVPIIQGSSIAGKIIKTEVLGTLFKFLSGATNGAHTGLTNLMYQIDVDNLVAANRQFSIPIPFKVGGVTLNDASSLVDFASTLKGTRPFPLMTQAQRTAIVTPAVGLHVYQTDGTEGVYVNKSTGWAFAY